MYAEKELKVKSIPDSFPIESFLLPRGYELLPSATEVLEFAFKESQIL